MCVIGGTSFGSPCDMCSWGCFFEDLVTCVVAGASFGVPSWYVSLVVLRWGPCGVCDTSLHSRIG